MVVPNAELGNCLTNAEGLNNRKSETLAHIESGTGQKYWNTQKWKLYCIYYRPKSEI